MVIKRIGNIFFRQGIKIPINCVIILSEKDHAMLPGVIFLILWFLKAQNKLHAAQTRS
jgi:hypothetical protein